MSEPFTITRHSTGEMLEGKAAREFLKRLDKKPAKRIASEPRYAATRRKPQANPRKELLWWGTLLAVVAGCWLGTRVNIAFNW